MPLLVLPPLSREEATLLLRADVELTESCVRWYDFNRSSGASPVVLGIDSQVNFLSLQTFGSPATFTAGKFCGLVE
jgi:hypothetical protein